MSKLNKILFFFIAAVGLILFNGCKEEEEIYPTFEQPRWMAEQNTEFTSSMIAIVQLPQNLAAYYQEGDELAAFIDGECRATGTYGDNVFYLLIKGKSDEQRNVTFKYYSSRNRYLYETTSSVPFETDGVYGTADNPIVLSLQIVDN